MTRPVLTLRDLSVEFPTPAGAVRAVRGLSLSVGPGRRLGLVGESGSGKTTTALAVMRALARPGRVAGGEIRLGADGTDLLALPEREMRAARLSRVAYIPQGAMNSLNPVMRVEDQLWDGIAAHEGRTARDRLKARSDAALAGVGLPARTGRLYPHELSGGMKQRVCIALATILEPELVIADEPTSALDVVTQRDVMRTLVRAQAEIGCALVLIGHDMGLMAQTVDELAVLRDGELVERGPTRQVISAPRHPYARELVSSVPVVGGESFLGAPRAAAGDGGGEDGGGRPPASAPASAAPAGRDGRAGAEGAEGAPLIEFRAASRRYGDAHALRPLSFALAGGAPRIVSVVGQSGSGKSTMGALMLGFAAPSSGQVLFEGRDVGRLSGRRALDFRRDVQAVFQDPYACFNPFYRARHALAYPFRRFGLARSRAHADAAMAEACGAVGLDPALLGRFPHQLSGGQRQRLLVARALMLRPKLLVADEPVSMVDASLRATILGNIHDLKERHGISVFYITHDLATAYHVSDYVIVLYRGRVVEAGPPEGVIGAPRHPYTRLLVDAIPWPDADRPWGLGDGAGEEEAGNRVALEAGTVVHGGIEGFTLSDS